MIFGNVKCNENISSYPKAIQKAINYLKENDLVAMEPGRYELDGDNMILQVLDVETTERSNLRPEVHRTYIDVQFLAKGKEKIGYYPDKGNNEIDEELLEARDIIFYKNNNTRETYLEMEEGSYAIFYPHDVHIPAIIKDESMVIRKIVIKVKVSTL
ncbi:YhcH/YjgK/YiaL family protein [Clostridium nigeriense]|uniref:YhcH/YjgK/YiaL family protein n=1 Tax=Clostridium nigeriense TaxID=1805470 RepID=UPI003D355D0B